MYYHSEIMIRISFLPPQGDGDTDPEEVLCADKCEFECGWISSKNVPGLESSKPASCIFICDQ